MSAGVLPAYSVAMRLRPIMPHLAVQLLAAALFFSHLSDRDLWPSHEARAAQNAQNILATHSLAISHLVDGTPEYQKPPLYYWLVAAAAWIRGGNVDAIAVRLPSALAGWLTLLAVMGYLQRRGRSTAAWIAGLALMSTHHWLAISRTGRIDVPLACEVTWAVLSAMEDRPWRAGLSLAAALLFKGPIGLVMAAGIIAVMRKRFILPSIIGIALAAPWFIWAGVQSDWEFWRVFFWHHNFERAAGLATDLARHPIWFYPVRLVIDALPWSLLLPLAVWKPRDGETRLAIVWLSVVIGLLSLSQFKRADYLLPAYPAVAIAIGCWAERRPRSRFMLLALATSAIALCFAWELLRLPALDRQLEKRSTADLIRQHAAPGQQIVFFRVEDHLLAYHLGPPIATVREWENLSIWVSRLKPGYVVMLAECVAAWPEQVSTGTLVEVERFDDRTDRQRPRTWVLLRSQPHPDHDAAIRTSP